MGFLVAATVGRVWHAEGAGWVALAEGVSQGFGYGARGGGGGGVFFAAHGAGVVAVTGHSVAAEEPDAAGLVWRAAVVFAVQEEPVEEGQEEE